MNKKINLIQKFLIKNNFSFYLVTNSDIHLNESPNLEQKDIFNLTGFDCSNGYLIILRKNILFFTDSRYTLAASNFFKKKCKVFDLKNQSIPNYHQTSFSNIKGLIDPKLISIREVINFKNELDKSSIRILPHYNYIFSKNYLPNFNISYQIDGGELITEVYEETINSGQGALYTFNTQPDFSSLSGDFDITISVEMDGDSNTENDTLTQSFSIYSYCEPSMDCSFGDGFQLVQIGDINNASECEGYGNFMSLSTDLELGSTNDLNITTGYGDQGLRVWLDYNDDSYFSTDEIVIDNLGPMGSKIRGNYIDYGPNLSSQSIFFKRGKWIIN